MMRTFQGQRNAVVVLLALFWWPAGRVVGQDEFSVATAIQSLEEFESSIWGLQFDEMPVGENAPKRSSHVEVSKDGQILRKVAKTRLEGEAPCDVTTWSYGNARDLFCFNATRDDYDSPEIETTFSCGVFFFDKGQSPFCITFGAQHGFHEDANFVDFVRRAEVEVTRREFRGKSYHALICRLENRSELTLLFDDSHRFRGYEIRVVAGDQLPPRHRYDEGQVVPQGESATLWGSFDRYESVGERSVLVAWELGGSLSGFGESSLRYERSNIKEIDAPIGNKISFPDLEIENGTEVSCHGRQSLLYVYRDGKLYLAADSPSVDAARRARWWRSTIGSTWYYTVGLIGFLGVFVLMIYLRNRNV